MRALRGRWLLPFVATFAFACSGEVARAPSPAPSSAVVVPDPVGPSVTPQAPQERQRVAPRRALRGAWISSVYNGTWPSRTGLGEAAAVAELTALLDGLVASGANAVFLQVRPESDALYRSPLEPWSRFVTGTQGKDPGYDPLARAIELAHARGLELHAWLNPFRGMTSASVQTADNHPTRVLAEHTRAWGSQLWMDPGAPAVQSHVLAVIEDLLRRYDVDGLHFDDYFYPYPIAGKSFPDDATFAAYQSAGGALARDDYRRANVDDFVRRVSELSARVRPDVRFGVSPFGIWRPGYPRGIVGLDAYAELYCDAPKWIDRGWVDYLAPQLYWPTTRPAQDFAALLDFWAAHAKGGRTIVVGHDLSKLGQAEFPPSEIDKQLALVDAARAKGVAGSIFFTARPLAQDDLAIRTSVVGPRWSLPSVTPPVAAASAEPGPEPPVVEWVREPGEEKPTARISVLPGTRLRSVLVYLQGDAGLTLSRVVPAEQLPLGLRTSGRVAVGVLDRASRASDVRVLRPPP